MTKNTLLYTGQRRSSVTGNYLLGNGYRGFNPVLKRFVAQDSFSPFGAGGLNGFAYCGQDPVNNSDPSGHLFKWLWALLGIKGAKKATKKTAEVVETRFVARTETDAVASDVVPEPGTAVLLDGESTGETSTDVELLGYHGTSAEGAEDILNSGPRSPFYIAQEFESSSHYAQMQTNGRVLRVSTNNVDLIRDNAFCNKTRGGLLMELVINTASEEVRSSLIIEDVTELANPVDAPDFSSRFRSLQEDFLFKLEIDARYKELIKMDDKRAKKLVMRLRKAVAARR